MTTDQLAADRIQKARAELILTRRFYGVLVSNVEPVLSRAVPRAATNSVQHLWNPDFVASITQEQLLFTQAHESEHDARKHSARRGTRDHKKWNEACDYAINIDLIDEGFVPLPDILLDARYRGMSAEDIYRTRELDEQQSDERSEEAEEEEDSDGDEQSKPDGGDSAEDSTEGEEDSDGDGQSGSESGEGDEQSETTDGAGSESGEGGQADAGSESGDGVPSDISDSCGEVLDAPPSNAGPDPEQRWDRIVRQAAAMAKSIGQLPGHVSSEIERSNNKPQDWREQLRAFFDQGALKRETWDRPNRRFIGLGMYLPGSQREGLNKVAILIDTSGSVDDVSLGLVRDEAQAALDDGCIDEIVVVYGDTRVTHVDTYRTNDEIEFDPRGRGGTDMKPLFQYVENEIDNCSLIVCFTDGYIGDAGPQPACPTLWAYHGYPDVVRAMVATAPWGAAAIDVGVH
jgi:predicted metal-dependent peptidase